MKKSVYLFLGFLFISTFGYSQIHKNDSKFSIGIIGTHNAITKLDEISQVIEEPSISYRIGESNVNLYGGGVRLKYQIQNWLSLGAEFNYTYGSVDNKAIRPFSQKVKVLDYGAFARFYPFQIKDGYKKRKFVFYVPIRVIFSSQDVTLNYNNTNQEHLPTFLETIEKSADGLSYAIVGMGGEFFIGKKFMINAEVTDDYEFADTRRYSVGLFYRF